MKVYEVLAAPPFLFSGNSEFECYMKILFLFTMLLAVEQLFGQATREVEYVITYDFTSVEDTTSGRHGPAREFLLLHAGSESRFHSSNHHFNDSMKLAYAAAHPQFVNPKTQEEAQKAADHFMSKMSTWKKPNPVRFVIRKDFVTHTFQNVLSYPFFPPRHMEETLILDWTMQTEQDTILGIPCSLATTEYGGRTYTAWYAPSIPIPDGPYVFSGLPGLILKVEDSRGWYTFTLREMSLRPQKRLWKEQFMLERSQLIPRRVYVEKCRKAKENPSMPGVLNVPPEKLLEMKERNRNRYYMLLESY